MTVEFGPRFGTVQEKKTGVGKSMRDGLLPKNVFQNSGGDGGAAWFCCARYKKTLRTQQTTNSVPDAIARIGLKRKGAAATEGMEGKSAAGGVTVSTCS